MTAVASRLRRLEQQTRADSSPAILIFWHEQLTPCAEHHRCDVEIETGDHHRGVIHLSFEGPQR